MNAMGGVWGHFRLILGFSLKSNQNRLSLNNIPLKYIDKHIEPRLRVGLGSDSD